LAFSRTNLPIHHIVVIGNRDNTVELQTCMTWQFYRQILFFKEKKFTYSTAWYSVKAFPPQFFLEVAKMTSESTVYALSHLRL